MCRSPLSTPVVAATFLIALLSFLSPATSFTLTPSRASALTQHSRQSLHPAIRSASSTAVVSTPTTSLKMEEEGNSNIDGMREGTVILGLALLLNVWMFSIPPEFRRARFCTEEDVKLYPEKHCTTFGAWRQGVADYYANGGGVNFDFSIEGKE
eukprot:CAMPEP_0183730248 /NCGR_PEP_ID=MMETSP0737-20130205/32343_1 /TAXON_ID=385413 /ORGANISM="Thalassiosira miniscula, Strain CCMP1093" /LENGTH=153 /DNA_ID=CAMNT_0025962693 /DNA_START=31 /DNA_END=492 /DNA_ORIENTATION=+